MGTSQIPLSALSEGSIKARTCLPAGFSGQWGEARIYGGGDGDGVPRRMCFWAGTTGLAPTQELHVEIPRAISACQRSQRLGWWGRVLAGVHEALGPTPGTHRPPAVMEPHYNLSQGHPWLHIQFQTSQDHYV